MTKSIKNRNRGLLHILQETCCGLANVPPWHDTVLPWHKKDTSKCQSSAFSFFLAVGSFHRPKLFCVGPRREHTMHTHTHTYSKSQHTLCETVHYGVQIQPQSYMVITKKTTSWTVQVVLRPTAFLPVLRGRPSSLDNDENDAAGQRKGSVVTVWA